MAERLAWAQAAFVAAWLAAAVVFALSDPDDREFWISAAIGATYAVVACSAFLALAVLT